MVKVKSGGEKKIHSSLDPGGVYDMYHGGGNSFILLDLGTLTPVIVIQVF